MQQTESAVPKSGCLADLPPEELANLVGAMVTLFSGVRSDTGLLINTTYQMVSLWRPDHQKLLTYEVASTTFERDLSKPLAPQIARSLAEEAAWDAKVATLPDVIDSFAACQDYDRALSGQDETRLGFYEELLKESACLLFGRPPKPPTALVR